MSSKRGELDLIHAAIISFSKNVHVRSTYQNRWVLDSVLSQLINEMIDGFDITTTKMNRALCGKQFKQIGDDSIVNSLLIYRRKFSKKWYYFFSTDKEDTPPSNKDWAVSPSVVSNVAPIPVAFKHKSHRNVADSDSLFVKNLLNDMKTCGKEE